MASWTIDFPTEAGAYWLMPPDPVPGVILPFLVVYGGFRGGDILLFAGDAKSYKARECPRGTLWQRIPDPQGFPTA
jgi:hypothetical protein